LLISKSEEEVKKMDADKKRLSDSSLDELKEMLREAKQGAREAEREAREAERDLEALKRRQSIEYGWWKPELKLVHSQRQDAIRKKQDHARPLLAIVPR
jgi:hypothetical protein